MSCRGVADWVATALALLAVAGCGGGGPKTYPVRGRVVLADGDIKELANGHVEFMLENDQTVRADGKIQPDGSFTMQTQQQGKLLHGAVEGKYLARIIPPEDEDGDGRKRRPPPIHPRFLDFKTSGLSFPVPTSGAITVTVSRR
jgi:hypothetical protein